jgi:hypothetical protein
MLKSNGDIGNTSLYAAALRRIAVRGRLWQDDADGDKDIFRIARDRVALRTQDIRLKLPAGDSLEIEGLSLVRGEPE